MSFNDSNLSVCKLPDFNCIFIWAIFRPFLGGLSATDIAWTRANKAENVHSAAVH